MTRAFLFICETFSYWETNKTIALILNERDTTISKSNVLWFSALAPVKWTILVATTTMRLTFFSLHNTCCCEVTDHRYHTSHQEPRRKSHNHWVFNWSCRFPSVSVYLWFAIRVTHSQVLDFYQGILVPLPNSLWWSAH